MQTSSLASEKLKKAIERNRAKQVKRSSRKSTARPESVSFNGSLSAKRQQLAQKLRYNDYNSSRKPSSRSAREFKLPERTRKWFFRLAWLGCLAMLGRLIVTEGGVYQYYKTYELLTQKEQTLKSLRNENTSLEKEIQKMLHSRAYQKKIVRDHLGYIANDEYLILFSSSKSQD